MIINNEPYLIEYNVRMGDPECQTILPKLNTDLFEIFLACCNQNLKEIKINGIIKKVCVLLLCSKGYPEKYEKNVEIKNLNKIELNSQDFLFHAGTKLKKEKIFLRWRKSFKFYFIIR